jgi:hypothetical protein
LFARSDPLIWNLKAVLFTLQSCPCLCFDLLTEKWSNNMWIILKYNREVAWCHNRNGSSLVTSDLEWDTWQPLAEPCSMEFNTNAWDFYVSLATKIYRHKSLLFNPLDFSRLPLKWDRSLLCWK